MTELHKQRILRIGCVILAAVILVCALIVPQAGAKSSADYYENAVLFWTNVERSRNGLSELKTCTALQNAAGARASEIVSSFSHTRPNGASWSTAIKAQGISYGKSGENIAAGKATPYDTVSQWMNSEGHRANILNSSFSHLGVGYKNASGSRYTHYWTQEFVGNASISGSGSSFYVAPTGLTASTSSLKLSVGETAAISGEPSPVYATEVITCTSSNSKVVKVTGTQVNVFTVKGLANGTATLTLKCGGYSKAVTVTVGTGVGSENPFVDVRSSDVYYKAVMWANKNNVVLGTDATHFSPNNACTRGQVVTFLWRAAGCPQPRSAVNPFTDVKSGSYCCDAVMWAYQKGIASGTDLTHFSPEQTITREQFVTMLWKYHGSPTVSGINPFTDLSRSSSYYSAVMWAYKSGVTNGIDSTHFGVGRPCERYQVVLFLYRDMA